MSIWTELSIGIGGGLVQKFYKTTTIAHARAEVLTLRFAKTKASSEAVSGKAGHAKA
jgi:hypothetical protein